jgi:hypothetical protein
VEAEIVKNPFSSLSMPNTTALLSKQRFILAESLRLFRGKFLAADCADFRQIILLNMTVSVATCFLNCG